MPSALDQLCRSIKELKSIHQYDTSISTYLDQFLNIQTELHDLTSQLEEYGYELQSNPQRLEDVQNRLAALKKLSRKHGLELPDLIKWRDELSNTLSTDKFKINIDDLERIEKNCRIQRDKINYKLTNLRKSVAEELQEHVLKYLRPLALSNVRFNVEFGNISPNEFGVDEVNFMFSANPGEPLAPLSEVASGGEMSRFLLALKTALAEVEGPSVLFFDEIDAGMSGRVSESIASALKKLSLHRQVFCITHQPLVAASADNHFVVSKSVSDGITRSDVIELCDIQDRKNELAHLAGGDFTKATQYAAGLLDQQVA